MKKTKIALACLVALGAIWTGGAYYTGVKAEQEFKDESAKIVTQYGYGSQVKLENIRFNRGVFSSDFSYDVAYSSNGKNNIIPFQGTLFHGPLPLNLVKQFNFMPAMFSSHIELVKNEDIAHWFTTEKAPLNLELTVDYDRDVNVNFDVNTQQLKLERAILTLDLSGQYKFAFDNAKSEFDIDINALDVDFLDPASNFSESFSRLSMQNGELIVKQGKVNKELAFIQDISYELKAENASVFTKQDKTSTYFKNVDMKYSSKPNGDVVDYAIDLDVKALSSGDFNVGAIQAELALNHLDTVAMNTLFEQSMDNQPLDSSNAIATRAFTEILQNEPQLKIQKLNYQRDSGKAKATSNIHLAKIDVNHLNVNKLSSIFKDLTFDVSLDKAMLKELISLDSQNAGRSKDEADKQAELILSESIASAKSAHFLLEDENQLKIKLHLDGDQIDLNGEKLQNEDIVAFLLMFLR